MTILVTGAGGNIGGRVLQKLHERGEAVRAAGRRPDDLVVPDGVNTVRLDLDDPATLPAALDGVSRVFLYPHPEGIADLVDAARAAHVERVVLLSSISVGTSSVEDDALARHHGLVEAALADSGLDVLALRPGSFASNATGWAPMIQAGGPVVQAFADASIAPVHDEDIADAAVAGLTGGAGGGRTVTLTGPEALTFREQIAVIGEVLGRDLPVHDLSRAEAQEAMAEFVPAPILASLLDQWEAAVGVVADTTETAEQVTGRPARTFRQWVEQNTALLVGA